jgi:hypothetical protein
MPVSPSYPHILAGRGPRTAVALQVSHCCTSARKMRRYDPTFGIVSIGMYHEGSEKRLFCNNKDPNGAGHCAAPSAALLQSARTATACCARPSPTLCPALPTQQTSTTRALQCTHSTVRTNHRPRHCTRAPAAPARAPTGRTRPPHDTCTSAASPNSTRSPASPNSAPHKVTSGCRRPAAAGAGSSWTRSGRAR